MKKLIIACILAVSFSHAIFSQDPSLQEHGEKKVLLIPDEEYKLVKAELDLTKKQKKELKIVYEDRQENYNALKEVFLKKMDSLPQKERKEKADFQGGEGRRPQFSGGGGQPHGGGQGRPGGHPPGRGERPENDDESTEALPVFDEHTGDLLYDEDMHNKNEFFKAKVKNILTEEQFKQWEEMTQFSPPPKPDHFQEEIND